MSGQVRRVIEHQALSTYEPAEKPVEDHQQAPRCWVWVPVDTGVGKPDRIVGLVTLLGQLEANVVDEQPVELARTQHCLCAGSGTE